MKKNKKQTGERRELEEELTRLMELTLMLENELYCITSRKIRINNSQ